MVEGLADKLKDLRRQNGYSQKQVADKHMVSPSIISGYENSERTPSVEILLRYWLCLNSEFRGYPPLVGSP